MHPRFFHFPIFIALAVTSCGASPAQPSELTSTDAFVRALEQQNATVRRAGSLPPSTYPFFSVSAQRLIVNDADVQVFEYPTAARANSDAARVSPSGTPIGQSQIAWMDTPNFYKRDRLIVLYVGHAPDVLTALQAVLGPPFAGGRQ